jgi:hypothetical protein
VPEVRRFTSGTLEGVVGPDLKDAPRAVVYLAQRLWEPARSKMELLLLEQALNSSAKVEGVAPAQNALQERERSELQVGPFVENFQTSEFGRPRLEVDMLEPLAQLEAAELLPSPVVAVHLALGPMAAPDRLKQHHGSRQDWSRKDVGYERHRPRRSVPVQAGLVQAGHYHETEFRRWVEQQWTAP